MFFSYLTFSNGKPGSFIKITGNCLWKRLFGFEIMKRIGVYLLCLIIITIGLEFFVQNYYYYFIINFLLDLEVGYLSSYFCYFRKGLYNYLRFHFHYCFHYFVYSRLNYILNFRRKEENYYFYSFY